MISKCHLHIFNYLVVANNDSMAELCQNAFFMVRRHVYDKGHFNLVLFLSIALLLHSHVISVARIVLDQLSQVSLTKVVDSLEEV